MKREEPDIEALWDEDAITAALAKGLMENVEWHRRMGFPMVGLRDGKIVRIPAEELPRYEVELTRWPIT
ncbi:MAG: hypothetical protein AB7N76_08845 [Planctomycetota bacterium]